jgi:hypothetical protein
LEERGRERLSEGRRRYLHNVRSQVLRRNVGLDEEVFQGNINRCVSKGSQREEFYITMPIGHVGEIMDKNRIAIGWKKIADLRWLKRNRGCHDQSGKWR